MSFLTDLLDRAKGWLDTPAAAPTATDVVPHDRFDEAEYADIRQNVPVIDTMITELSRKHDYVEDFMQDVHNVFTQGDPQMRDVADMAPSHVPNQVIINELAKLPEVQQMRASTRHDPYAGAMATVSMKSQLTQLVERSTEAREKAKEQAQAQQQANEAAQAAQAALQAAQALQDAVTQDENGVPDPNAQAQASQAAQAAGAALDQAQAAAGAVLEAREATQQAAQQAAQGMRADLRQAASQAAQEQEEEDTLMRAFGVEDGELQRMPFAERAALAQRLKTNRMAKFAKLIGQFKALQAAESRRKVKHAPDEVNNIVLGDDLTRLAPSEWINLASDELEDDFWLRYVNRQILCFDLIGTEKVGQGPIIVVCDESGSMGSEVMGGTCEAWSKALSLALCEQARSKNRDFFYIGFSSQRQQVTFKFAGGKAKLSDVIDMTEHFFGGGTHFERPLLDALAIVEGYNDKDGKRPDIVFITDDDYSGDTSDFMRKWNATKDKYDLRCFGIAMGGASTGGMLAAVSDNVRTVADMTDSDPRVVADLFRTI